MNQLNAFEPRQLNAFDNGNAGYAIDPDLKDMCYDYIGENEGIIYHEDVAGVEACERYMNGKSSFQEIAALYKFFGLKP